jgi:hypothetical protein
MCDGRWGAVARLGVGAGSLSEGVAPLCVGVVPLGGDVATLGVGAGSLSEGVAPLGVDAVPLDGDVVTLGVGAGSLSEGVAPLGVDESALAVESGDIETKAATPSAMAET